MSLRPLFQKWSFLDCAQPSPKKSSLDCAQPSPKKVIPRLRSSCPPIVSSLIFVRIRPPKSHPSIAKQSSRDLRINSFLSQAAFSLFLSQHSVFLLLSYRNIFSLPVIPQHFLSSCHSGLFFYLSLRPPSRSPGQY